MGWKLAEEIAWARPDRPGPEWWTLLDIAQDARDATRRSMPGIDYLMGRGKCSKRTVYRRLDALRQQNLITVIRHAAPGQRAIYEITAALIPFPMGASILDTCSGASVLDTHSDAHPVKRVPEPARTGARIAEMGDSVSGTHAVTAPSYNPVINLADVVPPSVEVPELAANGAASRQPIEQETWLALHPRM